MIEDNNTTTIPDVDLPHVCVKCHRSFKSEPALRMHKIRMHSNRKWDTSKNFRGAKGGRIGRPALNRTEEQRLQRRRLYQQHLRDRYYREGKNSKGEVMPPGWKPRLHKARRMQAIARRKGTGKWADPEFKRQYQKALYHRNKKLTRNHQELPEPAPVTSTPDITGDAARAIIMAASVIRAVTVGMKITT